MIKHLFVQSFLIVFYCASYHQIWLKIDIFNNLEWSAFINLVLTLLILVLVSCVFLLLSISAFELVSKLDKQKGE